MLNGAGIAALPRGLWRAIFGTSGGQAPAIGEVRRDGAGDAAPTVEIATDDPVIPYLESAPGVVELERLTLDSPAVRSLRAAGVKLVVPLVSQGELIGLLNLGPRLSEQDYSADDRTLLHNLATQAAPAVRVAQLVRERQTEAQARERIEQELQIARLVQKTLLPRDLPTLPGWRVAVHYQPARAVGGDFYDFLQFRDGRIGLVVGDVTDKGVPAALVMASTRSVLRSVAQRFTSPGDILKRANDALCPDMPPSMFVTCLCAILNPSTGQLRYANAGHNLPYRRRALGISELRATGMPLGLMPGMTYEVKEISLDPGDTVLFYSDGLVEAHNPRGEMFGFPRLAEFLARHEGGVGLIGALLDQLARFAGPNWEQEDDVTLAILQRSAEEPADAVGRPAEAPAAPVRPTSARKPAGVGPDGDWRILAEMSIPSEPGNERTAMEQVAAVVREIGLPAARLDRLRTAVAEAALNGMEHGNKYNPELPVAIQVLVSPAALMVRITDQGGGQPISSPQTPDLAAKLAGLQSPRGWGLFIIERMVDRVHITSDEVHHTVELTMYLREDVDAAGQA